MVGADRAARIARYSLSPKLERVIETFRRYLHLPDPTPLVVALATVAANLKPGDAVWLLLLGPPSCGKTEILNSTLGLPNMFEASTLSEASLLSGTPAKDVSKQATGGLLREIGQFGILVLKDFTSVLSMPREQRAQLLAALREIYDGSWTRRLGTDGARRFHWHGKLGFLAGCTDEIEDCHAVISSMGDRYVRLRMPALDPKEQGLRALLHQGQEQEMRRELVSVVTDFFGQLDLSAGESHIGEADRGQINSLATFSALARSAVKRDGYKREIDYVPDAEFPARLSKSLLSLLGGLLAIGAGRDFAFDCVRKVGLDCIPKVRRQMLDLLIESCNEPSVANLTEASRLPETTVRRALEDLQAHGLVVSRLAAANHDSPPIVWSRADGTTVLRKEGGQVWCLTSDAATLLAEAGCI